MQRGDAPTGGLESGDWRGETSAGTEGGSSGFHRGSGNGRKRRKGVKPDRTCKIGALRGGGRAIVNGELRAFAVQRLRMGDAWVMLPCIGTPALLQAMWSLPKARSAFGEGVSDRSLQRHVRSHTRILAAVKPLAA
jgi:hypothetical protein